MTQADLVSFIESHCETDPEILRSDIAEAWNAGTYIALEDRLGLSLALIFKLQGDKAYVNYAVIRPDVRGLGGVGLMPALALQKFPNLQFMAYHREFKYPKRPVRFTHINRYKRIIRQAEGVR